MGFAMPPPIVCEVWYIPSKDELLLITSRFFLRRYASERGEFDCPWEALGYKRRHKIEYVPITSWEE